MRACLDCVPCFIRQALDASRLITDDENKHKEVMTRVLKEVSGFDLNLSPPEFGQIIHRIIRKEFNNPDPYEKLKKLSTQRALSIVDSVKEKIKNSNNSFETAVRFAIAGNIMDFGMKSDWDDKIIMNSFDKALKTSIDSSLVEELYNELSKAKTILVLGDNAGEAVFDKLLIETFPENKKIYYAVKGSPVINDVTLVDAEDAKIHEVAEIISNGADIQGTVLRQCSEEFMSIYNNADVIISKGQGNFETLTNEKAKIYFLLQIKCQVIADFYDYKLGDWKVTTTNRLKESQ
jgi:damage-control phosphatase, subfamily I